MGVDGITGSTSTTTTTTTTTSSEKKDPSTGLDMKDFYIYDENGNIIGVDEAKLAAAQQQGMIAGQMQGIQMASAQVQQDSFIRTAKVEAAKKAEEAEEAEDKQSEITGTIDEVNAYLNAQDTQGYDLAGYSSTYEQEVRELQRLADELTKASASNTTVINGSAIFVARAQDVQEQGKTITEQLKEDENAEATTDADRYNETYNLEAYETDNFFTNNPFMASALETTDVEEEDTIAA